MIKNLPANAGDTGDEDVGSMPGWGRYPGGRNGNLSSVLSGKTSWMEEPGGLQSKGSQRV